MPNLGLPRFGITSLLGSETGALGPHFYTLGHSFLGKLLSIGYTGKED